MKLRQLRQLLAKDFTDDQVKDALKRLIKKGKVRMQKNGEGAFCYRYVGPETEPLENRLESLIKSVMIELGCVIRSR